MAGRKPTSTGPTRINNLAVQTSALGTALTRGWGTGRIKCNLIWYGAFASQAHSEKPSGGKGSAPRTTSYTYSASVMMELADGGTTGIVDVRTVYRDKEIGTLSSMGLTLFRGTPTQSPWGYLSSTFPSQALAYSGIAYVAAANYPLTDSASLQNHSFEVQFQMRVPGKDDADASLIVPDLLENSAAGVPGWGTGLIADLSNYGDFCLASGLLISPILEEQRPAREVLSEIAEATNSDMFWSEGLVKIKPRGDTAVTGNGRTWTPDLTSAADLDESDFLCMPGGQPVTMDIVDQSDAYNNVQIEYLDRANQYNTAIMPAQDLDNIITYGRRKEDPRSLRCICDGQVAQLVAQQRLQRVLYIRESYSFQLGEEYSLLEQGDYVTLTTATDRLKLDHVPVRITKIQENEDNVLMVTAEGVSFGNASPAAYNPHPSAGFVQDTAVAPGSVSTPVLFDGPTQLVGFDPEVWMAVGSTSPTWGGCNVWVSTDGVNYVQRGVVEGAARYGVLTASLASHADPDNVNTLSVDLTTSLGDLIGGSAAEMNDGATLSLIGTELVAYQNATLTSAHHYNLAPLRRGLYGSAPAAHSTGSTFVRLDDAIFKLAYGDMLAGDTIYVKLASFNVFGQATQDLSAVTAYAFTLGTGSSRYEDVLDDLVAIASDSILSHGSEKQKAVIDWNALYNDSASLDAKFISLGSPSSLATAHTTMDNAIIALASYLTGLSPAWNDLSTDTPIVSSTWSTNWNNAYQAVAAFRAAITGQPGADGAGVFTWAGRVKVTTTPTSITSIDGSVSWDQGAYSTQGYSGDVMVTARNASTTDIKMIGLNSDPATDSSYASIDYAVYINGVNFEVYLNGTGKGAFGTVGATDTVYVRRRGTMVEFGVVGEATPRYTVTGASATNTLYLDAAMNGAGSSWQNVTFGPVGTDGSGSLTLINDAGCAVGSNWVRKVAGSTWDAGAHSQQGYPDDVQVTAKIPVVTGQIMVGLNSDNTTGGYALTHPGYEGIDYAFYIQGGGAYVYENGSFITSMGSLSAGDTVYVRRINNRIQYGVIGEALPRIERPAVSGLLYADFSLVNVGESITNITLNRLGSTGGTFNLLNNANCLVGPNSIKKVGGVASTWDAGAQSVEGYAGDVQLTARVPVSAGFVAMIALNTDPATDSNYTSLDYALYCSNGSFVIYESGVGIATVGTISDGDVVYVRRRGTTIEYGIVGEANPRYVNPSVSNTSKLYLDTSIYSMNGEFTNISFQPLGTNGQFKDTKFRRSVSQPPTPTGDNPAGWSDAVPDGTDTLWQINGYKTFEGVLINIWSTPKAITGLTFRGPYASTTTYYINNSVTFNGGSYVALQDNFSNHAPSGTTSANAYWDVLAAPGAEGAPATPPSGFSATITVPSGAAVNLYDLAVAAGYTGHSDATITYNVPSGNTIMGASNGGIGLDSGTWPSGYTIALTLNVQSGSAVYGGGGSGGAGGGSSGGNGGDAIYLRTNISGGINVSGTVASGGGGGGGGATTGPGGKFGGGGGGGGNPNGEGGEGGSGWQSDGNPGSSPGAGGTPGGGAGGTYGASGSNSSNGGGTGGAPGYAVRKNGYTATVTGSVTGTVG